MNSALLRDALGWANWDWDAYAPVVMAAVRSGVPVLGGIFGSTITLGPNLSLQANYVVQGFLVQLRREAVRSGSSPVLWTGQFGDQPEDLEVRQRLPRRDDDVVQHAHVHQRQRRLQRLRQCFVRARGLHGPAGMVMGQHHCGGVVVQGLEDDFARVHAGLSQRAAEEFFQRDQPVLRVEEEGGKHLVRAVRQVQLQVIFHGVG